MRLLLITVLLSTCACTYLTEAKYNLIVNGGFESGNIDFNSEFVYKSPDSGDSCLEGDYTVTRSPTTCDTGWSEDAIPHNGSSFLVANGITGFVIWAQNVTFPIAGVYAIEYYTAAVEPAVQRSQLRAKGAFIGAVCDGSNVPGQYVRCARNYVAATVGVTVEIAIVDQGTGSSGYAIDDISCVSVDEDLTAPPSRQPSSMPFYVTTAPSVAPTEYPTIAPTTAEVTVVIFEDQYWVPECNPLTEYVDYLGSVDILGPYNTSQSCLDAVLELVEVVYIDHPQSIAHAAWKGNVPSQPTTNSSTSNTSSMNSTLLLHPSNMCEICNLSSRGEKISYTVQNGTTTFALFYTFSDDDKGQGNDNQDDNEDDNQDDNEEDNDNDDYFQEHFGKFFVKYFEAYSPLVGGVIGASLVLAGVCCCLCLSCFAACKAKTGRTKEQNKHGEGYEEQATHLPEDDIDDDDECEAVDGTEGHTGNNDNGSLPNENGGGSAPGVSVLQVPPASHPNNNDSEAAVIAAAEAAAAAAAAEAERAAAAAGGNYQPLATEDDAHNDNVDNFVLVIEEEDDEEEEEEEKKEEVVVVKEEELELIAYQTNDTALRQQLKRIEQRAKQGEEVHLLALKNQETKFQRDIRAAQDRAESLEKEKRTLCKEKEDLELKLNKFTALLTKKELGESTDDQEELEGNELKDKGPLVLQMEQQQQALQDQLKHQEQQMRMQEQQYQQLQKQLSQEAEARQALLVKIQKDDELRRERESEFLKEKELLEQRLKSSISGAYSRVDSVSNGLELEGTSVNTTDHTSYINTTATSRGGGVGKDGLGDAIGSDCMDAKGQSPPKQQQPFQLQQQLQQLHMYAQQLKK